MLRYWLQLGQALAWRSCYEMDAEQAQFVSSHIQNRSIDGLDMHWSERGQLGFGGDLKAYICLLEQASRQFTEALAVAAADVGSPKDVSGEAADVAADGIFVPRDSGKPGIALLAWMARNGLLSQLALLGTPRVLFHAATNAQADESLLRRLLQQCTLVREHFHAILETGLDQSFVTAEVPHADASAWQRASVLDEVGAIRMKIEFLGRHAVALVSRDVAAAQEAVRGYVQAGDYRDAGALCLPSQPGSQGPLLLLLPMASVQAAPV